MIRGNPPNILNPVVVVLGDFICQSVTSHPTEYIYCSRKSCVLQNFIFFVYFLLFSMLESTLKCSFTVAVGGGNKSNAALSSMEVEINLNLFVLQHK